MTDGKRNRRALWALVVIGVSAWFWRSLWWDNYVNVGPELIREQQRVERRRGDRSPRRSQRRPARIPEVAALPQAAFRPDAVRTSWDPLSERNRNIRLTEIHYHPEASNSSDLANGREEFLELTNLGREAVTLARWQFTSGLSFEFPEDAALGPGESWVLCRNKEAFQESYGMKVPSPGVYEGALRNSGERLVLRDADGVKRMDFRYRDHEPWPEGADGGGGSLQLRSRDADETDPAAWYSEDPSPGEWRPGPSWETSIFGVRHSPQSPQAAEPWEIRARLHSLGDGSEIVLKLAMAGEEYVVPFSNSKQNAGVVALRAELPGLPHGTLVRYWFEQSGADSRRWPKSNVPVPNHALIIGGDAPESVVPTYHLVVDPQAFQMLHDRRRSNETIPAAMAYEGKVFDHLRIRLRGAFARSWPKKAYKIFFNRDERLRGRSRLNLNSGWRDPAFVREILTYRIYERVGSLSLESRIVRVLVNSQFWGMYVEVEQPDKTYLEEQGLKDAVLYKADSPNNQSDERYFSREGAFEFHYRKETKEERPFDDLITFCRLLNQGPEPERLWANERVRSRFVNYLCATMITQNWDGFSKNHYIGFEEGDPFRWFFLPWDLDRTLGDHWRGHFAETRLPLWLGTQAMPGVTGWNRVFEVVLQDPIVRREVRERLRIVLRELVHDDWIREQMKLLEERLAVGADRDRERWGGEQGWRLALAALENGLIMRRTFLLDQLASAK